METWNMLFKGISKEFSIINEDQYRSIGDFWDEMALLYGLENLQGLGYQWTEDKIYYAIGLKGKDINGYNLCIELPDTGWTVVDGNTDDLKDIYDEIYQAGPLTYEIETFTENGTCKIQYYRSTH